MNMTENDHFGAFNCRRYSCHIHEQIHDIQVGEVNIMNILNMCKNMSEYDIHHIRENMMNMLRI